MTVPYDRGDYRGYPEAVAGDDDTQVTVDGLHAIAAAINRLANEVGAVAYAVADLIHTASHSERSQQ